MSPPLSSLGYCLVQEEPQPPHHEERSSSLVQEEAEIKEELPQRQEEVTGSVLFIVQEEPQPPQIKEEQEQLPERAEEADGSTLNIPVSQVWSEASSGKNFNTDWKNKTLMFCSLDFHQI